MGRARRVVDPTKVTFAFAPGDYVVHATHGIALFREIVRQEVLRQERDYLLLEYARGDKLYVPVEQIGAWEQGFYKFINERYPDVPHAIATSRELTADIETNVKKALDEYNASRG